MALHGQTPNFKAKMERYAVPAAMVPHVWELVLLGADSDELGHVLGHTPRGRPKGKAKARKRGAPALNTIPMGDLDLFVQIVRADGIPSDRTAIRAFLELHANEHGARSLRTFAAKQPTRGLHTLTPDGLVAATQQRLSRWRALHK